MGSVMGEILTIQNHHSNIPYNMKAFRKYEQSSSIIGGLGRVDSFIQFSVNKTAMRDVEKAVRLR